jgi:hypothetical protein
LLVAATSAGTTTENIIHGWRPQRHGDCDIGAFEFRAHIGDSD